MGRPKTPWRVARIALQARSAGATRDEAAVLAGISRWTVDRLVAEHGLMIVRPRNEPENALSIDEREQIRSGIDRDLSNRAIADEINRHRSTVWRDIKANGGRSKYRAFKAHDTAADRARRCRPSWIETRPHVWAEVCELLRTKKWSPEQISAMLQKTHHDESEWWVSHESIYQAIFVQAKPELRKELAACLRTGRARRRPMSRASQAAKGGKVVGMVNVSERPAEVEDRAVPGHWEGDLIIGKEGKTAVATLVERSTRFGMLIQLDDRTAVHTADRIAAEITRLPGQLLRSLTWDQGTELAEHQAFTVATNVPVFFCDPHSPWQRGTNENWNGLVRQFLPKGTDLSVHSQSDLDDIAALLNERPRKTLEWDTPAERFNRLVATTA